MPKPPVDPAIRERLGTRISAVMAEYNRIWAELRELPEGQIKTKIMAYLEQRRAAVQAIIDAHRATLDAVLAGAVPRLQGLGADELTAIQTQLEEQQSKLAALSTYFDQYKAAVAAGRTPPVMPPELSGVTTLGIPTSWLAIGAALVAVWFMVAKK